MSKVAVIMGSDSDFPVVKVAIEESVSYTHLTLPTILLV